MTSEMSTQMSHDEQKARLSDAEALRNATRFASVWERALAAHVAEHIEQERDLLQRYEALAVAAEEEHVRYLIGVIAEDERRHHRILADILNRIAGDAVFREVPDSVPRLAPAHDREALTATTDELLAIEHSDLREIKRLRREARPLRATTLLDVLLEVMELDTRKHIRILEFLRHHVEG
jgi:rubrerythrin